MSFIKYIDSFFCMRDRFRFGWFWLCSNKDNDYLQIHIKIIVVVTVVFAVGGVASVVVGVVGVVVFGGVVDVVTVVGVVVVVVLYCIALFLAMLP